MKTRFDKAAHDSYLEYGGSHVGGCPFCAKIMACEFRASVQTLGFEGQQRRGRRLVTLHRKFCLTCKGRFTEVWLTRKRIPKGKTNLLSLERPSR